MLIRQFVDASTGRSVKGRHAAHGVAQAAKVAA
jgi:hypothetical protein